MQKRLTVCVTRWWAGREKPFLHNPVSEEAKDGSIVAVKSLFKQGGFASG
jgi:hypothetical protein